MQAALTYRTNRDLFSNYYLDEYLPETEEWDEVSDEELQAAYDDINDLWEREKSTAPKRNESQLEEKFIRPMFRKLGIPFEVEESTNRTHRRPDYGFFETEDTARQAFERREEGGDFYENAVAVADAKRWGRPLDTRGSGEHKRDFENPSYQIHVYLQETPVRWAVLTDGKKWRLYYGPTSHRLDSYYEIDLPTILENGDLEDFKYFYLFFRHEAFLEDAGGDSFLDDVYDESNVFAQELGEDLQDNIYEAIKILSEGFLQYPDNDLDEDDLDLIHDSSLIYLYRVIFVLYAEAEGRDLLDTDNDIYGASYSLNSLKQEVAEELDSGNPKYRDWQNNLGSRLDELFKLIDQGSKSRGIPEEDLHIPAYNGGLFRTDPDNTDSAEAQFLANHEVGDAYLAKVIELLTRSTNGNGGGKIFVDYSSLDVRHLGSVYEGLLEYQLNIADEPLALDEGEYISADSDHDVVVQEGDVYLTTDSGERKATGSYYTPEYVVEYIVENTLGPLVDDIRTDLAGQTAHGEGGFAADFADRIFDLKILDPAMGSGHFLTSAVDYLAREIIDAQEKQAAQDGIETVNQEHDINWARRQVAQRCIYGVDLNPLAVELAKVSLWLRTLAAEQPLAFLDHHLKTGNSLVGSDIEEIEELESETGGNGENATLADFGIARKGTIEQLMRIYQDFIAIENQDLADVKEMEAKYDEFERNKLRQRLGAMANVHTAEQFGIDTLPSDAYKRLAAALEDDAKWTDVEQTQWFQVAQEWAQVDSYFHWKLEFPEVYYDAQGDALNEMGFDAVIGNPPYISNWNLTEANEDLIPAIERMFPNATKGHWDIYVPFCQQAINLLKTNGYHSFIVSNAISTEKYSTNIRKIIIENYTLNEIVDFDENVFEGVSRKVLIYSLEKSPPENSKITIAKSKSGNIEELGVLPQEQISRFDDYAWRTDLTTRDLSLKQKLESNSIQLGELCWVNPGVVAHSGSHSSLDFDKDDTIAITPSEGAKRYVSGRDIGRHSISWDENYMEYEKYEPHFHRPKSPVLFEPEKIIFSGISAGNNRIKSCYDNRGYYTNHSANHATEWTEETIEYRGPSDREPIDDTEPFDMVAVAGIVNSKLLSYYFSRFLATKTLGDDKTGMYPEDIRKLPVFDARKNPYDRDIREFYTNIAKKTEEILTQKRDLQEINLHFPDYLTSYDNGLTLGELSRPPSGLSSTFLTRSMNETDRYEKIRIDSVEINRDGDDLRLSVIPYVKPAESVTDEYETNSHGYATLEPIPAMDFRDLDTEQADLIESFVPYAVEEAGGFGGFRDNATATITPLDRLESLTLPALADVRGGLIDYREALTEAEKIEKKIQAIDEQIDEIVYDLYGLTDEEIEMVETAVQDD
jgi:type II restriction/modification system DNA methylase subunit YeeA